MPSIGVEHLQDRGPVVLAVAVAVTVISFVFVALRFASRVGIVRRVGWDDWTILIAWVRSPWLDCPDSLVLTTKQIISLGFSFSICWGTRVGLGHHEGDIDPSNESALKKADYAFSVLYVRHPYSLMIRITSDYK